MVTLATFSKSEDAQVTASLLLSGGVDAVVLEDSAYGGNLLGASSAAIRIEVPEEQVELAREILGSEPSEVTIPETLSTSVSDSGSQKFFCWLVVLEVICNLYGLFYEHKLSVEVPAGPVTEWLESVVPLPDWAGVLQALWMPFLAVIFISSLLLFFFVRIGRWLFLLTVAWGLVYQLTLPTMIPTGIGMTFSAMQWMLVGAIGGLMFLPGVRERFRE